jgi:predicted MFS family arabinose efflux permease
VLGRQTGAVADRAPKRPPSRLRAAISLNAAVFQATRVFQAMANASVQLAVDPRLRGRVMGLYMLAFMGGTPIGAPIIGMITSHFGARAGMTVCGAVPVLAAAIVAVTAATGIRARAGRSLTSPASSPARILRR